ncbi:MAG: hypothetical protein K0R14_1423 [Burkholderiales bacterium]|jgi:predicted neuraminidase|nr:hypothetical protein [Burkholderiales bacterium]
MKIRIKSTYLLYTLVLCFILVLIYSKTFHVLKPKFKLENNLKQQNSLGYPVFESYIIPQPYFLKSSHSSAFTVLNNGDLLAFWFAGSHEGKPDVKIWSSRFTQNHWTEAKVVVSPQMLSDGLAQHVHKVGNPVVYSAANGVLHLFVVSVGAIGGWSASNIDHLQSTDEGINWKNVKKLSLSPLLNISTLVRTKVIPLEDGGFYLPVYHEMIYTYPELLRFDDKGNFIGKVRMTSKQGLLQPALVTLTPDIAYSFTRNKGYADTILYMQLSHNAGVSWSEPRATNLHNRDSSVAAALVGKERVLMVRNPSDRGLLVLSASDDGLHFKDIAVLENKLGKEYSYPSIQVHDGLIDILYTDEREKIKHIRFNEAWLDKVTKL